MLLKVSSN